MSFDYLSGTCFSGHPVSYIKLILSMFSIELRISNMLGLIGLAKD